MSLTRIPGSQVPVLENSGLMSREWYRFLYNLFEFAGGGASTVTPTELQAEVDALEVQVSGIAAEVNTLEDNVTALDAAVATAEANVAALAGDVELVSEGPVPQQIDVNQLSDDLQLSYLSVAAVIPDINLGAGSFYDTTTQTPAAINTAYAITFDTTSFENRVYRGATTSRIYVTNAGLYNFQFSAQLDNTSGGNHLVYIWARVNGTDVPYSASQVRLKGTDGELVAAWNFFIRMAAGEYFELMYSADDTSVQILSQAASSPVPAIPSVILTVNQVFSPYGH